MNTINKDVGNVAFINKTKKQAKNLLKLAKQNQLKIDIINLSQAQEILAQLNGFPNWHALEKFSSDSFISESLNQEKQLNQLKQDKQEDIKNVLVAQEYEGIAYFKRNDELVTYISIDYISSNYKEFVLFLNETIKNVSFQYNMGFSKVEIEVAQNVVSDNRLNKNIVTPNNHDLLENLGITIETYNKLFNVESQMEECLNNKAKHQIQAKLIIVTKEALLEEHLNFCKLFLTKDFSYIKTIEKDIVNSIESEVNTNFNTTFNSKFEFSFNNLLRDNKLIRSSEKESVVNIHSKWIYALYLLSTKNSPWQINIDIGNENNIKNESIQYNDSSEFGTISTRYVEGLYKSLLETNIDHYKEASEKMFQYHNQVNSVLPWQDGLCLMNVSDGKKDFYNQFSSYQSNGNTVIMGKPGSGKSTLINLLNLSAVLNNNIASSLPMLSIIDIGRSSKSLIEMLSNILPAEKKSLVGYYRPENNADNSINIFDTPLGCRYPSKNHLELLSNIIGEIVNDDILDNNRQIIKYIIMDTYKIYSQNMQFYFVGRIKEVDDMLESLGIKLDNLMYLWEVVDVLFSHDKIKEAKLAQRQAVPKLSDVISALQHKDLQEKYKNVVLKTGESMLVSYIRQIQSAVKKYQFLSHVTNINLTDKSIISLDIDNLTSFGEASSEKDTAIAYLWARYAVGQNFNLKEEDITNQLPEKLTHVSINSDDLLKKYKKYHQDKIKKMNAQTTTLCYDEYHRVSNSRMLSYQISSDMDDYKCGKTSVVLCSQSERGLDLLLPYATTTFILDSYINKQAIKTLNLSDNEVEDLKKVHGPRSNKLGVMLAIFKTYHKNYSKLISLPVNNLLKVALSTTSEDVLLRKKLSDEIGYLEALQLLSDKYPYGIRKITQVATEQYEEREDIIKFNEQITDKIVNELVSEQKKKDIILKN